jgi:hypothetical protein
MSHTRSQSTNGYARIPIALLVFGCMVFAQDRSRLQGWKPYTPTRLEWLAVDLNASLRIAGIMESSHFDMSFIPLEDEDAILIYVVHLPGVDRKAIRTSVDYAKAVIATKVKTLGWSWLKVKEKIVVGALPDE